MDPIVNVVVLLSAALVGGMIAHRLRQPIILGYLVIGVAVGPHALGLIGDLEMVEAAATIGVALLMFTLGLEISISQLREVGKIGILGGISQIAATLTLGLIVGFFLFRWPLPQAGLFGLIISLSSTAVCLKILMERGELASVHGRIMIAILILQDIGIVVMMVVIPLMGGLTENLPLTLAVAVGKALLFIGLAIVLGRWVLPWLLGKVGGVRARELFLLTVLVLCLAAAMGTQILGLSIVFGSFLVGLVLRETRFVHQALAEITPLRDIFATLFFVSLGMLLDPVFLINNWQSVALLVAVIIVLKILVIFSIVRLFGHSSRIAILTGVGLFQIGEFSFILAQSGVNMGIVSAQFYSLILASAIITMLLTPVSISLVFRLYPKLAVLMSRKRMITEVDTLSNDSVPSEDIGRVVIAGYGRVGENIAQGMQDAGIPYLIVDLDPERISDARNIGRPRIYGDATNINVLSKADLGRAQALVVTYPDPIALVTTVKTALSINPKLKVLARVHRAREANELKELGVIELVSPEYEASFRFIKRLLNVMGLKTEERRRILALIRKDEEITEFNPDHSV
ncbi:MAG: cation:proton antiporter [Dehalococcoidales bacterium]|nr:MAG: cation:proton antiporter [Dehalococcoidales bacterium]